MPTGISSQLKSRQAIRSISVTSRFGKRPALGDGFVSLFRFIDDVQRCSSVFPGHHLPDLTPDVGGERFNQTFPRGIFCKTTDVAGVPLIDHNLLAADLQGPGSRVGT